MEQIRASSLDCNICGDIQALLSVEKALPDSCSVGLGGCQLGTRLIKVHFVEW